MNIDIVDRMNQIEIQEKEIERRQRELESRVKAPADAEKYKCEILAEANKKRAILEAGAEAEAVAMKGDAEAFAIEIKAKAEAEQMAMKADAFKEYGKAAKVYIIPSPFKNYPIRKRLLSGRFRIIICYCLEPPPENNFLLSGTPLKCL